MPKMSVAPVYQKRMKDERKDADRIFSKDREETVGRRKNSLEEHYS